MAAAMRLAHKTAISQAWRYARRWSSGQGVGDAVIDDIELVVCELVTNALRHGTPPDDVDLFRINGTIRGEVGDASTTTPRSNSKPDERGGYGLNIVTSLATRWGSDPTTVGEHVWFEIDHT
jgi:hypothetical protein